MHLLRAAVRTYAWGSRTAIADFTGRPSPTPHPEAELWFGAHPADPAWLETDQGERSLLDALRDDPEGQLGAAVRGRFGENLVNAQEILGDLLERFTFLEPFENLRFAFSSESGPRRCPAVNAAPHFDYA